MKFLLFLLGVSFFFIFFLFSRWNIQSSLFPNLFIEAQLYFFVSCILLFFLLRRSFLSRRKKIIEEEFSDDIDCIEKTKPRFHISREDVWYYVKNFFHKYIYYIGIIFFYSSFTLLLHAILWEINITLLFLLCNIGVIVLYCIEDNFPLFQDFIRVNTFVVSLYYIFKSIAHIFGQIDAFLFLDIINIILVFVLFTLFFISSRKKSYISTVASYALVFSFLQLSLVLQWLFGGSFIPITVLSLIIAVIWSMRTQIISWFLWISQALVRIWTLLFFCLFLLWSSIFIFSENFVSLIFILLSFPAIILLYMFHKYFQNYFALFMSFYWVHISWLAILLFIIPQRYELASLSFIAFFFSLCFLFLDKCIQIKYSFDRYFFRIFSIWVNLVWVFCFFFFSEVSILKLAFLLFGESLYFFYSYYSISKISSQW